ncbi:hypothetical protein ACA910_008039 [Epithemia clementina (nom. ined.)]
MIDATHQDDRSISSTVESNAIQHKLLMRSSQQESTKKRTSRVSFNEQANISYQNHQMVKTDLKNLWYSDCDFKYFKKCLTSTAKSIIQFERECKKQSDSYRNVLERLHYACSKTSPLNCMNDLLASDDYKTMKTFTSTYVDRVGMEKMTIKRLWNDRALRRREAIDTITEMQEHAIDPFCHIFDEDFPLSPELRAEEIARIAQDISRPSCLFATLMAHALSDEAY